MITSLSVLYEAHVTVENCHRYSLSIVRRDLLHIRFTFHLSCVPVSVALSPASVNTFTSAVEFLLLHYMRTLDVHHLQWSLCLSLNYYCNECYIRLREPVCGECYSSLISNTIALRPACLPACLPWRLASV